MKADTKSLWRAILLNAIVAFGYVSTAATFLPWLTAYRPYLWLLSGALLLIGAFRGALKVITAKNDEIGVKDEEITRIQLAHDEEIRVLSEGHEHEVSDLNRLIDKLQRDPFDEDLKARVKAELDKFDDKERAVLKNLLHFGSWDYNKVMPGLNFTVQEQAEVFRKGYGAGFLDTEDVMLGGHKRLHYKARPQFIEALKKYLYETPHSLEKLKDL